MTTSLREAGARLATRPAGGPAATLLAAGPCTALNDDALQAFLDESEKKLR